jgi:hypothetical protein
MIAPKTKHPKHLLGGYVECAWCGEPKKENTSWHTCEESQLARKSVNDSVQGIWESVHGGTEYWGTKTEYRRLQAVASQITATGGEISNEGKELLSRGWTR